MRTDLILRTSSVVDFIAWLTQIEPNRTMTFNYFLRLSVGKYIHFIVSSETKLKLYMNMQDIFGNMQNESRIPFTRLVHPNVRIAGADIWTRVCCVRRPYRRFSIVLQW